MELLNLFSIIGIGLEVFGFLMMIKYYEKLPKWSQYQSWRIKSGFGSSKESDMVETKVLMDDFDTPYEVRQNVEKTFVKYWRNMSKIIPIQLVIGGLILQGIQATAMLFY
jgi:hypothetical protein